jgi:phosphatidylserine/phosphatidylglycerophosphate/cardiolipin synthase-like enzyme
MMNFSNPTDVNLDEIIYTGSYEPRFQPLTIQGTFLVTPILSPDTSEHVINSAIESAHTEILIEQLEFEKDWHDGISPFIERLIQKVQQGVNVKIIINYNPDYYSAETLIPIKQYLEANRIQVKFLYTNWSYFKTVHNKGMIIDNQSVLISSINWNENSVRNNREAGVLIHHPEIAQYYADVFYVDWNLQQPQRQSHYNNPWTDIRNILIVIGIFFIVFVLIFRDWRKRRWT